MPLLFDTAELAMFRADAAGLLMDSARVQRAGTTSDGAGGTDGVYANVSGLTAVACSVTTRTRVADEPMVAAGLRAVAHYLVRTAQGTDIRPRDHLIVTYAPRAVTLPDSTLSVVGPTVRGTWTVLDVYDCEALA